MKKYTALLLVAVLLLVLASTLLLLDLRLRCESNEEDMIHWDTPPEDPMPEIIYYEGQLYEKRTDTHGMYGSDLLIPVGNILSTVDAFSIPTQNMQSNFDCIGCGLYMIAQSSKYIFLKFENGTYATFEKLDSPKQR